MQVQSSLTVCTGHLNIGKLARIGQYSPSLPDNLLSRFPIVLRVSLLDQRNHLSPKESVGRHVLEFAGWLYPRVPMGELDLVNLLFK